MEKLTMTRLAELVPDEASAYRFLEDRRWKGTPTCCHCASTNVAYLNPENGCTRRTRTGAASARRVWQCRDCRKQFSALTGTVMQGTKISVRIWVFVMFEIASNKNGIAAREVERRYGLTPRSAWHLLHRLREAMATKTIAEPLGGDDTVIIADETYIGGSLKTMNRKARQRLDAVPVKPGSREGGPGWNKASVLSLLDTRTGEVRSQVMLDVTGKSLRKAIADQVQMSGSVLWTDEAKAYRMVATEFAAHEAVNHKASQYARYRNGTTISTNAIESFFSQLKRSLDGTHHHVSRKHLARYLGEFDFRHSTRKMPDTVRFSMLVERTEGVRLAYRPLIAA
ncbi:MAG TPA: IS1595 family transposase [Aquihabitans sp.]|nr:IS1595 family transposase [Aquihabitans sp.]